MDEKILIKSEKYNLKKVFIIILLISALVSLSLLFWRYSSYAGSYDNYRETYLEHQEAGYCKMAGYDRGETCFMCRDAQKYSNKLSFGIGKMCEYSFTITYSICPVVITAAILALLYLWLHSYDLTVTDKRIYGKIAWGKRVDLPVDSISATATIPLLKGVSVSTSSGKISFLVIKNANEIYKVFSDLLIERQKETVKASSNIIMQTTDEADKLKKYKDLLDSGVITQEEFDAKKKQLLDL